MMVDSKNAWDNCLKIVQDSINEQSFKTWFEPIVPVRLTNNVLTIQVPSQFFYEWLEDHYVHVLRKAIDAVLGKDGQLEYSIIIDKGNEKSRPYVINLPTHKNGGYNNGNGNANGKTEPAEKTTNPFQHQELELEHLSSYLNPNYSFDNFIEGDCNRLARSAGLAVAQKPGITSFNPLMLYGGVGLGKTHLVQAIGNHIKHNISDRFVLYVSSEKFTNQFIDAVRNNSMQAFTNFYLQVDVLVIDDIQFLSGKERTQEIFFHIFNHLHQSGKQIIMTSDRPPKDMQGLQDRLLSRFKWGLTADLQQPDLETRIAIIEKKLLTEGLAMPKNVIEYLAHSVDTNIRELEGVIISLIAQASLNRKEIDLELARQTLQHIVHPSDREITIEFIQKYVADHYDVELDELKDKTRKKEVVIPRQIAMYFAKEFTNFSLKAIGYHFGGRDHSTVIHAIQSVSDMMDTSAEMRNSILTMQKNLRESKMKAK
jgi:chromosomal replication initiator protein